jgi:hypothetical protein
MALITGCSGANGRLIRVNAQVALPLTLSLSYPSTTGGTTEGVPGTQLNNSGQTVLSQIGVVTRLRASQEVAAQFQNALTDVIYITPFGDKPGTIELTFVANRSCDGSNGAGLGVIQHYLDRRLMPLANKRPATIIIGPGVFRSYLISMVIDAESSGVQLVQGTLVFRGWPQ